VKTLDDGMSREPDAMAWWSGCQVIIPPTSDRLSGTDLIQNAVLELRRHARTAMPVAEPISFGPPILGMRQHAGGSLKHRERMLLAEASAAAAAGKSSLAKARPERTRQPIFTASAVGDGRKERRR